MEIKVLYPSEEYPGDEIVSYYELETLETYWKEKEYFVQSFGDYYQREVIKEPSYSYDTWCQKGIEHSQELRKESITYRRKSIHQGTILTFPSLEAYNDFLEDKSPVVIRTGIYFLMDNTPVTGVEEYFND